MKLTYETVNGRRVPTHIIQACNRKADATGIDHAAVFLTGDIGLSDGAFGDWFAVPDGYDRVMVCGLPIELGDKWETAPYVAVAGEPRD